MRLSWRVVAATGLAVAGIGLLARPQWSNFREHQAQRELAEVLAGSVVTPLPLAPGPAGPHPAVAAALPWTPPVYGRLRIPAIGLSTVVVNGATLTDYFDLMVWGPAHLAGSAAPGAVGNAVIFGHNDEFGSPFWYLHRLHPGDAIDLVADGRTDVYRVTALWPVEPTNLDPVVPLTGVRALTLVTCAGFANTLRLAVRAVLTTPGAHRSGAAHARAAHQAAAG